jgi:hypothetical protein
MKRTRTEQLRAVGVSLLLVVLSCALPSAAQTPSERATARSHFDRGLALAKASDYEAALREFERAYAVVPHYSVLYNIAQAQLALGRTAEAGQSFRRYLDEGGSGVEPSRRAEVEAQLAAIEPSSRPAEPVQQPVPAAPAQSAPAEPPSPPPFVPVASASGEKPVVVAPPALGASGRVETQDRPPESGRSIRRTMAYVLGGASIALTASALGHYAWNRGRYEDWQSQRRAYDFRPTEYRRTATNDLARSISRASVVTVALWVGASATLGTSVVLFVSSRSAPSARHAEPNGAVVGLRGRF